MAAAFNVIPLGMIGKRQKAVVFVKTREGFDGEFADISVRGGPDGSGHGKNKGPGDNIAYAFSSQMFVNRKTLQGTFVESFARHAIKSQNAIEQPPEGQRKNIGALSENAAETRARVLQI
ncbi:MAG: hypothetical protein MZU95_03590 [Desulfomicrobium escambiense]|nr:hypothetical protein [Desulfomicrobium escambiense]